LEVHVGNDHRGYQLKQQTRSYLESLGHVCVDHGTDGEIRADYPDFAKRCGEAVARAWENGRAGEVFGIVFCGSGVGIAIAANKVRGARCVVAWCEHAAEYGRRHNHANLLAFGADLQTWTQVRRCLDAYLSATTEGERHAQRVKMISEMEQSS
jgi:ribose 5-phosphate isomerase B